jgi:peptidoglycan lytic transglycosylase
MNIMSRKLKFTIGVVTLVAIAAIIIFISRMPSSLNFTQEGVASWYGPGFAGHLTANGEIYNPEDFTAAHKTLPLGSIVRVTDLANGVSVLVRINDRGPYVGARIIDLSRAAASAIGITEKMGIAKVRIDGVSKP